MFKTNLILLFILATLLGIKNEKKRDPKVTELYNYRLQYVVANRNERIEIEKAVKDNLKDLNIEIVTDTDLRDFLLDCRRKENNNENSKNTFYREKYF